MFLRVVSNINRAIASPDIVIPSLKSTEDTRKYVADFSPPVEEEDKDPMVDDDSTHNHSQYDLQDLVQENKYLRNELTLLCQRIIELEEIEKRSVPLYADTGQQGTEQFGPQSPCGSDPQPDGSCGKIGTAMLQIQKLEEELHRERLLMRELSRRIEVQEKSIIEKEDFIASLENVVNKLLSDLETSQCKVQQLEERTKDYERDYEYHRRRIDEIISVEEKAASLEALLHEHQLEMGNLVEGKQELHVQIEGKELYIIESVSSCRSIYIIIT
jgi:chromosome segregation ATPase